MRVKHAPSLSRRDRCHDWDSRYIVMVGIRLGEVVVYSTFGTPTSSLCSLLRKWNKQVLRGRQSCLADCEQEPFDTYRVGSACNGDQGWSQAQRIMGRITAPATNTIFTSDGHFSTITFRNLSYPCRKKWPKGRFSSGPFSSTKCGKAIAARAPVPLSSPLHAHEFRDCARHGRASALPERPAFVGFQCFV